MDLTAIGQQFGLNAQQTQAAFDALAPVVAAGLRRNAQSDGGLSDLIGALAGGGHARYAEDPGQLAAPQAVDDGNAILGHIFGSKDVSRGVAQQLSASSGIGESVLKKLLPIIAAMVMGQMAKGASGGQAGQGGGGLGDILGSILGSGAQGGGGGLGDILGSVLGGAAQGGGGGGLGDILGGILGGSSVGPEELPQARAPGRQTPQGGGLNDILRDVLGSGTPESQDRAARTRQGLDQMLGGGTSQGSEADNLLRSVEEMLRRR